MNKYKSRKKSRYNNSKSERQSGQILIVVLAFSAILGAGLLSVYNTAKLTTEKRDLINAADAASYSGATILAQGLNYTAYTNRAILANNALIGQMVSIKSTLSMSEWYWKNTDTVWKTISGITKFIPYIGGAVSSVANAAAKFGEFWGGKVVHPVSILAEVLQATSTAAIGITNNALWLSQQVHLADSLVGFETNMIEIAKTNAPDANVDAVLHATAFGPMVTLGSFASKFKIKVRGSKRTVGNRFQAEKDEYMNFITETNRAVQSNSYVQGRNLIPNAMGLWIATGCETNTNSLLTAATSGLFQPSAGFGSSGANQAIQVLDEFASVLSIIANPIMCLFDRHGGTELFQNEDGKFSWAAVDVTAFRIPGLPFRVPFAGGSVVSFTKPSEYGQRTPESLKYLIDQINNSGSHMAQAEASGNAKTKYFGHQVPLRPDCVEFLSPGTWHYYTVSTDSRVTGTCAVLNKGVPDDYNKKGLWGGRLDGAANKTINASRPGSAGAALFSSVTGAASTAALNVTSSLGALQTPNISPAAGPSTSAPPGISGQASSATTTSPLTADMAAAGGSLTNWGTATTAAQGSLASLTAGLSPATWVVSPSAIFANMFSPTSSGRDGGPGFWEKLALQIFLGAVIDVDALIDLMSLKISDGVERPRTKELNRAFHALADGLPPFFWDVRVSDKHQAGRAFGQDQDLIYTDEHPQDYNDRRYNLGPLVYLPLIKPTSATRTAAVSNIGGEKMGLPDYEGTRGGLRAIGKARIFFREPADHWNVRYKTIKVSSLILPYWQARNESLSYVDKWGLLALDGVASVR